MDISANSKLTIPVGLTPRRKKTFLLKWLHVFKGLPDFNEHGTWILYKFFLATKRDQNTEEDANHVTG